MVFDFLKKKKSQPEPKAVKQEPIIEEKKEKREDKLITGINSHVLVCPHVTEKATDLAASNQYVFKVFPDANKIEIKKAIENLYKVKVISVKVIKIAGKARRLGRGQGWKKGYKKAIIKVRAGQKIEAVTV